MKQLLLVMIMNWLVGKDVVVFLWALEGDLVVLLLLDGLWVMEVSVDDLLMVVVMVMGVPHVEGAPAAPALVPAVSDGHGSVVVVQVGLNYIRLIWHKMAE